MARDADRKPPWHGSGRECGDEAVTERIRGRCSTICRLPLGHGGTWRSRQGGYRPRSHMAIGFRGVRRRWDSRARAEARSLLDLRETYIVTRASTSEALRMLPPAKPKREDGGRLLGHREGTSRSAEKSSRKSDLAKLVAFSRSILKEIRRPASSARGACDLQDLVKLTVVGATAIVEHLRAPLEGNEKVVGLSKQALAKLEGALEGRSIEPGSQVSRSFLRMPQSRLGRCACVLRPGFLASATKWATAVRRPLLF